MTSNSHQIQHHKHHTYTQIEPSTHTQTHTNMNQKHSWQPHYAIKTVFSVLSLHACVKQGTFPKQISQHIWTRHIQCTIPNALTRWKWHHAQIQVARVVSGWRYVGGRWGEIIWTNKIIKNQTPTTTTLGPVGQEMSRGWGGGWRRESGFGVGRVWEQWRSITLSWDERTS